MDPELDFPLLDDVLPMTPGTSPETPRLIRAARPRAIGPLVEYAHQSSRQPETLPPVSGWPDEPPVRELRHTLELGRIDRTHVITSHAARPVEFHWVPLAPAEFSAPSWIMFLRRFQDAAERAGFRRRTAAGLAGAFGEMSDNAIRHSLRPASALCGYRWAAGEFEYVVADAGQGVLASLRSCPDYAGVHDDGEALMTALTEGESRFGRGRGYGTGFRQMFMSLADLTGHLRFRTGDHVLTIDGTDPALSRARISQLGSSYCGFLVSVVCRPG